MHKLVLISPLRFASRGSECGKNAEVPASLSPMRYVLPEAILRMNLEPAYAEQRTVMHQLQAPTLLL